MRLHWFFPAVALVIFAIITFQSYRWHRRYYPKDPTFLWGTLHLDSDPLNRHARNRCGDSDQDCEGFELRTLWVEPGPLLEYYLLLSMPAFLLARLVTAAFAKVGVSEVVTFMICMPIALCAWYYVVGRASDRVISLVQARMRRP